MRLKLKTILDDLKFRGMAEVLDRELDRAQVEGLAQEDVLYHLLSEESRYRAERTMAYRIRQAKLPREWALESFPFDQQPGVDRARIYSLATLDFIKRAQNVVFIGTPGEGKTGLATGLARKALLDGYRVRFYNAQDMLDDLFASLVDRSTSRILKSMASFDLLIIDELGYLSLKPEQVNAFFKLTEMRYGNKATIITTNLDYEEWYQLFKCKPLVDALLDRLRHHCITIKMDGPSLRTPQHSHRIGSAEKGEDHD
ncbi:IS21-like element helper ATPase IstB [Sulfidibacter corallicola]|uniref:IS21-like element helper ATPase IstB n=1 Tax=Sulfidibacter corallicola TaxID=2818388 RepID=A0A8A4TG29_SULCO|nr:IS21-like element helper ATPase IstB [Sulfidibacter corallicola]QTD48593.1 IS21-like element helper ATPase IstB [Sulfidibacter corallicola]